MTSKERKLTSWDLEQEDEFLELVLPSASEVFYQRALVEFGKRYERDSRISLDEGDQFLRRRSNRRSNYSGPATETSRTRRDGILYSWAENRVLDWAAKGNSEGKQQPDAAYLANLLQRTVEDVEAEIVRRSTTKMGVVGFNI